MKMRNLNVSVKATVLAHQSKTSREGQPYVISTVFDYENKQAIELIGLDPVKYPAQSHVQLSLNIYPAKAGGLGLRLESASPIQAKGA